MKTGNTLRTAKNSLLCFFMALTGGFLVACGSDSSDGVGSAVPSVPSAPQVEPALETPDISVVRLSSPSTITMMPMPLASVTFPAYLFDTAAEGVAYSGPTGNGKTGKGGVFLASEGVFEFSIGATTLGSVSLNSNWQNDVVTPADFMGIDDEVQAITIARIMQGLDFDNDLKNGISISQDARGHDLDLFDYLDRIGDIPLGVVISARPYTIPSASDARAHLVATRQCLFSGGYVGDYEGMRDTNSGIVSVEGQSYYAVEPFANRVRRFTDGGANNDFESFAFNVGVTGSTITLSEEGNTLSFITPRLVTATWQYTSRGGTLSISSGTENLTLAAGTGNPGATRRIVGVETTNSGAEVEGMYVLDYFEEATVFRGQLINVDATNQSVSIVPLSLTIANGGSWPAVATVDATTLTLIGNNATIAVGVVRENDNYGRFDGVGNELSGTWCDIGGAVGSTVAPTPPTPTTEITIAWNEVEGASFYKLSRSTMTVSVVYTPVEGGEEIPSTVTLYTDTPPAGPTYSYRVQACNSDGCSELVEITWSAVDGASSYRVFRSADGTPVQILGTTPDTRYVDSTLSVDVNYMYEVEPCNSGGCSEQIDITWDPVSLATSYKLYRSTMTVSVGMDAPIATVTVADGVAPSYKDTPPAGPEYFYQLEACNSAGCSERSSVALLMTNPRTAGGGEGNNGDDGNGNGNGNGGGGVAVCMEQAYTAGQSCEWKGLDFVVMADGSASLGSVTTNNIPFTFDGIEVDGVTVTFVTTLTGTGSDTEWTIVRLG